MTLDDAIEQAIALNRQIKDGNIEPAYASMQAQLAAVSQELDISTLLPGGPSAELGMAAKKMDAPGFYAVFKSRIRANICAPSGEFGKLMQPGLHGSVGAIVTALAAALSLPAVALPLLVSIAVLISQSGIEAFCKTTET
ncbi:MAG: hypothetical protein ACKVP5_12820 [Aestuariivirga sp.]